MERITVEELIKFKMLPFDVCSENGDKIISAGEILTSGKLLQIGNDRILYKKMPEGSEDIIGKIPEKKSAPQKPVKSDINEYLPPKEIIFDKTVNRKSKFKAQSQVDMKSYYATAMFAARENEKKDVVQMVDEIKDKIIDDVRAVINDVKYCSQLKLLGNYDDCHSLNTAILAVAMGYKLEYDEDLIEKLTQAALLHNIGLTRLPKELLEKSVFSQQDNKLYQKHTQIGYKVLKHEMGLPEDICLVALEHHENNDGSGYPFKLSGEQIGKLSRIVGMCSFFDDLTTNKTQFKIKNTKEALRVMLEVGTKKFFPELLYQFVNMFNYNDLESYDDMIQ
jgi:HD-GYP domain-containing protein (c-di-GMP phosphodiesterase class II)